MIEQEALGGVELDLNKIKLDKYFKECDKHLQRIEEAFEDLSAFIPLTAQSYKFFIQRL
ncbi:MAG: hypothetical protein JXR64_06545 [Spirochaetales bacterium]|nr:hypothetical protein [Spirochaetales bacterium]